MCKGIIGYEAHQVSVLAIMVTKKYEYEHKKAFFPISYLSKTHLRKSEIRSNYESPYNTNISLIAAGENPPYIFCC